MASASANAISAQSAAMSFLVRWPEEGKEDEDEAGAGGGDSYMLKTTVEWWGDVCIVRFNNGTVVVIGGGAILGTGRNIPRRRSAGVALVKKNAADTNSWSVGGR